MLIPNRQTRPDSPIGLVKASAVGKFYNHTVKNYFICQLSLYRQHGKISLPEGVHSRSLSNSYIGLLVYYFRLGSVRFVVLG